MLPHGWFPFVKIETSVFASSSSFSLLTNIKIDNFFKDFKYLVLCHHLFELHSYDQGCPGSELLLRLNWATILFGSKVLSFSA